MQQGHGIDRWARLLGIPSGPSKDRGSQRCGWKGSWAGARGESLLGKLGPNLLPHGLQVCQRPHYPRWLLGTVKSS